MSRESLSCSQWSRGNLIQQTLPLRECAGGESSRSWIARSPEGGRLPQGIGQSEGGVGWPGLVQHLLSNTTVTEGLLDGNVSRSPCPRAPVELSRNVRLNWNSISVAASFHGIDYHQSDQP